MDINIGGMFLVAKFVGRYMVEQNKGGSIIQTSSIYGIMGPDNRIYEGSSYLGHQINTPAVYATSKSAVVGLTKFLSTYWATKNIRVNTITPGGVESGQNDTFINNYSKRVPMQRMAEPQEIAGALLYLASDASSYVTGQNIIIDGGLSAW
jgi:NAD(P)-dependent dehydrogenase (short-subunit alcohol dehydrogenase family)